MRRLILLRHTKSDWPDGMADIERPLAPRGKAAAPRMGAYLVRHGLVPDLVLVSPARRTRETWNLAAQWQVLPPSRSEPRIYEAAAGALFDVLLEQPNHVHTLMMVGHNPGSEDLAALLVGSGHQDARERMAEKFPTGALAVIDLPIDEWGQLSPGVGRLDRFVTPRSLEAGEGA